MSPEEDLEYTELDTFVGIWATQVLGVDPGDPAHPANVSQRIAAKLGKSKALVGLRQAANDAVDSLQDLSQQQIEALDIKLRQAGAANLSELYRRYTKQYSVILNRRRIRNETEYYLLKGLLDSGADSIGPSTRNLLATMLESFEHSG